ncbi:hypothetical protein CI105_06510 [Candidatus Izimaplasma bacterium ZiA1]|uniref:B12-binding domain-containing radical SAM protein n=1 Tax=Candidatus Izimoplasma sp. ZiA1 TaxID=2024899 RepID=UPI000BAA44B9|nr:hypothetical protein CI105_06510 [Candidatus Izimaplasma bacterium ZiA1]
MKTLLVGINAKYIHTNNAIRLLKVNASFEVSLKEFTIKDSNEKIIEEIKEFSPKYLGFSCYIWNIEQVKQILQEINLPDSTIILGGPEVSYDSEYLLKDYPVDYILKGEGEIIFDKLITSLNNGLDISPLTNISYKKNDTIINKPIVEIKDLNTLKQPYYLIEDINDLPNKIAYIETSRGCPYKCSYCLSSLEEKLRFFDMETVKKSILHLMENNVKTFKFLDRTFNANKKTLDLFDFIINNHYPNTVFQFEITGDILDPKIIEYLNEFAPKNLFRFEIGIQSTNEHTNSLVNRIQDKEKLFNNIILIQDQNVIDLHLDLIAGLPKENLESFKNTFNEVYQLNVKELQLGFLKMLRGTKIRNEYKIFDYTFNETAPYEITSNTDLSNDDLNDIHNTEKMLEIYHNRGFFKNVIFDITKAFNSPYDFFNALYAYYDENNLPTLRYQVFDLYINLINFLKINLEPSLYKKFYDLLKIEYLSLSKIKPKLFFHEKEDKKLKQDIYNILVDKTGKDINYFYKYGVLAIFDDYYYVFTYKNLSMKKYQVKRPL